MASGSSAARCVGGVNKVCGFGAIVPASTATGNACCSKSRYSSLVTNPHHSSGWASGGRDELDRAGKEVLVCGDDRGVLRPAALGGRIESDQIRGESDR